MMFKKLRQEDFALMLTWLEAQHVKPWWDSHIKWTPELIAQKYASYVKGYKRLVLKDKIIEKPMHAFIIYVGDIAIGYIQCYNKHDFPPQQGYDVSFLPVSCAGVDLFIGDETHTGKGIGSHALSLFLETHVFKHFGYVFVDPDSANSRAIRAYGKSGFFKLKEVGKTTLMLRAKNSVRCKHDDISLYAEHFGDPKNPAVLLIAGAGAPCRFWRDELCERIAANGYFVARFDHRDTGLSSSVNYDEQPYSVFDLAQDALCVLDALHISKAHIVGHSMGGVIAQIIGLDNPDRARSITSMSVGFSIPDEAIMVELMKNKPTGGFEDDLQGFMRSWKILNGKAPLDKDLAIAYTKDMYDRSIHTVGVAWNHIRAQSDLNDFRERLKSMSVPTLFIHGSDDALSPIQGALENAEAVPNSTFQKIENMGHMFFNKDIEQQIITILTKHFAQHGCKPSYIPK